MQLVVLKFLLPRDHSSVSLRQEMAYSVEPSLLILWTLHHSAICINSLIVTSSITKRKRSHASATCIAWHLQNSYIKKVFGTSKRVWCETKTLLNGHAGKEPQNTLVHTYGKWIRRIYQNFAHVLFNTTQRYMKVRTSACSWSRPSMPSIQ